MILVYEPNCWYRRLLADILVYRCGFAAEKKHKIQREDGDIEHVKEVEPLANALHNIDTVVDSIAGKFDSLEFYLSGTGNWRLEEATVKPYKGNRSPFNKPVYYKEIREYIVRKYGAVLVDGMEADDAIGIRATTNPGEPVCIVSIDKDLDMIPGEHYNWVKDKRYTLNGTEATRNFYKQVLTGDSVDNIPGIYGLGPRNAERIIGQYSNERAMWQACRNEWYKHYPDGYEGKSALAVCLEVAKLLWIAQRGRERFEEPK